MSRLAIFGDIGGHAQPLARLLRDLGADPDTGRIPADLQIVSVGDTVHRGPDSLEVVRMIDRFLRAGHGRWTQLIGNHEWLHLPVTHGQFHWNEPLDPELTTTITGWWNDRLLHVAAAVDTDGVEVRQRGGGRAALGAGELLITHAGLTRGMWRYLGKPTSAGEAAFELNATWPETRGPAWNLGEMITGEYTSAAGPMWASPAELYTPWYQHGDLPFHQAHGHAAIYFEPAGRWQWPFPRLMQDRGFRSGVRLSAGNQSRVQIGDKVIFGTDPSNGASAHPQWCPLVLPSTSRVDTAAA